MSSVEKGFRHPAENSRIDAERENARYQKIIAAIDELHAMAVRNDKNPEVIADRVDEIYQGIRVLQDRLLNRKTTRSALSVIARLKEVIRLYVKHNPYFDEDGKLGIRNISDSADALLDQAMQPGLMKGEEESKSKSPVRDVLHAIDHLFLELEKGDLLEDLVPDFTTISLNAESFQEALKDRAVLIQSLPHLLRLGEELSEYDNRCSQVRRLALDLVGENLDQLMIELQSSETPVRELAIRAARLLAFLGTKNLQKETIDRLEKQKEALIASDTSANPESEDWSVKDWLFENPMYRSKVVNLWSTLLGDGQTDELLNNSAMHYIEEVSGMDGYKLFSTWARAIDRPHVLLSLADVVSRNFDTIQRLEDKEKGCAKVLNEKFGIYNFGRYSDEVLLKQYAERNDTSRPYGVVLYPYDDHKGSFFHNRAIFDSLDEQLAGSYCLRIAEAGTKFDITRLLHRLDRAYGEHKISFAIIGGHGSKESINFGGYGKRNRLVLTDLADHRARNKKDYFEKDATLILFSCSTGFKGGIGQALSRMLHLRVIAPDKPSSPESIGVSMNDQGINFSMEYRDAGAKEYEMGIEKADIPGSGFVGESF